MHIYYTYIEGDFFIMKQVILEISNNVHDNILPGIMIYSYVTLVTAAKKSTIPHIILNINHSMN